MSNLKYKRILLKVSGEALLGKQEFGIDYEPVDMMANEIKSILNEGVEVAGHNPVRIFPSAKSGGVAKSLLKGCKFHPVRLPCFGAQIHMGALLFDKNFCSGDIGVDKVRALVFGKSFHGNLKLNKLGRIGDPEYRSQ